MSGSKTGIVWGIFIAFALASSAWGAHPRSSVTAKAAILIDNQTGEVLWQRNPDLPLPPASTTKIVTAMVALQSGRLDDAIVVTPDAALAPPSKISLRAGWRMRVRDLVYALLLNSANDAAVALADGLGGSVPGFAERMNAVARALGATRTHFVNPNGLPADNHYSTARDLAVMFGRALQNPIFENVVSTKTAAISPAAGSTRRILLRNHNRLLGNYRIQVVGKTGWTRAAKKCFVGAGRVGGREVGVAVLGSTDLWGDVKHLIEYGLGTGAEPAPASPDVELAATETDAAAGDDEGGNVGAAPRVRRYFVDVSAFHSRPRADRLKNTLRQAGYHASVEQVRHGRRPLYRVLVGSYPDRRTAERAAIKLKSKHRRPPTLVLASR